MLRCPICGGEHKVKYYDPYDGRLGKGTGFYFIKCDRYERPIEISCVSLELLEHATKEACILKGFNEWKNIGTTDQLQGES